MDVSALKDYVYIAAMLLSVAAMVYTWLTGRSKANATSLREHEVRLTKIETAMEHTPGHDDLAKIYGQLDDLRGDVREMNGSMKANNLALGRVLDFLMQDNSDKP